MEEKLKEIMAEIFGVKREEINDDSGMNNMEAWDSLSHLQLIAMIEERFGISIDTDNLMKMTSFGDIKKILESQNVKK